MTWEGDLAASPEEVWDACTRHTSGWLWEIDYEPWVGGAERGITDRGTVTVWDPPRRFTTRAPDRGAFHQLDYVLRQRGSATWLCFTQHGVTDDYDREVDAYQQHTDLYYHSLGEYLRHFAGRDAVYVAADAPEPSAPGTFAKLRRALSVIDDVAAGDPVRLTPAGLAPIEGVVDYATPAFLGVRSANALYRFYGRDAWHWPVGVGHHLFAEDADKTAGEQAWRSWLGDLLST